MPRSATTARKGVPWTTQRANPKSFLGEELRRARIAAGFTSQEALAAKLGYDRSVIAKAETGDRPPSPDVAAALQAELFPRRAGRACGPDWRRWPGGMTGRSRAGSRAGWKPRPGRTP